MQKIGTSILALAAATIPLTASWAQPAAEAPREINVTNDPAYAWGEQQIVVNPRDSNQLALATVGVILCDDDPRPDCEQVPAKFAPAVPGLPAGLQSNRAIGFYRNSDFTAIYVYHSNDRGKTWARTRLPLHPVGLPRLNSQGDPSLSVGPDGTLYASWDANDWGIPDKTLWAAGVGFSVSRDWGRTWSPAVLTGTPVDGPKTVADKTVPSQVYTASSTYLGARATGNPSDGLKPKNDRWVAMTRDGVKFTAPQGMGGAGAQMTAAHGVLATAFNTTGTASPFTVPNNELCGSTPAPCTIFQTTADGGATWSRHVVPVRLPSGSGMAGSAMVAADPTQAGRFSVGVSTDGDTEYQIYTTADSGVTWSGPARLSDDKTKTHYFGVMDYSPDGVLGVAWHTRDAGPSGPGTRGPTGSMRPAPTPFTVWAVISRDKGASFSQPIQVSSASSPGGSRSGDDYSDVALDRDYIYVSWADWRPGTRQNYMGAVKLSEFKPNRRR